MTRTPSPVPRDRRQVLAAYMSEHGLKSTAQRDVIFETFFNAGEHVAVGELHRLVQRRHPRIGYVTVYRTMKMLTECGLASERHFDDGQTRYEPHESDEHHDHLICRRCGLIVEFHDDRIERIQHAVARRHGFAVDSHRHEVYGLCTACQKRGQPKT